MIRANQSQVNGIISTLDDIDRKLTFIAQTGLSVRVRRGDTSENFTRTEEVDVVVTALTTELEARKTTLLATLGPL